ncbi:thiamine pyrophosphate-binding protein [Paracoccus sp. PS-1]|uniref:thiamine pyrophosphate-binding protein n=1 Tax=unclassified Paracoccus (in: a-proteobacteria) TaxID=2688777 RepID=UPI00048F1C50|nr:MULTISPECIES: thiamine pyrophosphate-binding protein [unclassified Paracoccus (in: a-proteobacteria)]MDQ7261836.1 thiamine pyrophosphate-binding protein [Paracoccus sp. PS1]RQP04898.1 MAG: thiamine pyrophosphate-binding protein [Paracoccus sp. BP8]UFM67025.1 thiamine pyrophosphate-binding protein [Paracoccus sp. MA]
MKMDIRLEVETVGDLIARYLADIGVTTIFGVISIHNMPILDAVARQDRIRFVPARGEAGAMNMADAYARVSGRLGVCLTSTGTAAGNAAGAQAEALTAGTQLLHITTQVDREFADRDRAAIHDVPRQPKMLEGVSKSVFRMWDAQGAVGTLTAACSAALSAPSGPVSLEIPVDVQRSPVEGSARAYAPLVQLPRACDDAIAELAERVRAARRPMLWLGGGARGAGAAATELVRRGFGVVTSTNGRAVVAEDEPASLGAFNMTPEAVELYRSCDLMIVVGSRLRGNETQNNRMPLPRPLVQIDADAAQGGRNYPVDQFIHGDAADVLARLVAALPERLDTDEGLKFDIARVRAQAEGRMRDVLGPYRVVADVLNERIAAGRHPWVRDVTISNSTFGNRYVRIAEPRLGVHALGGGIGQGVAMGIGAALASDGPKAVTLLGDGGTMLGIAEMITAVEERAPLVYVLMNDRAYGVIRNIQDAQYGSRHHYSALATPDFRSFCASIGMPHRRVDDLAQFEAAFDAAIAADGPQVIEIDMCAIGPFAETFAGPPAGAAGKTE